MLLSFDLPTRGTIRIDGIDTRHLAANESLACFGVALQETVLFAGTILANLHLANSFCGIRRDCHGVQDGGNPRRD